MKFIIDVLALAVVVVAQPQQYQQYKQYQQQQPIAHQYYDSWPEGNYQYSYKTPNGSSASQNGHLKSIGNTKSIVVHGRFGYTGADGTPIEVQYVADENGFQPQGAHLPVNAMERSNRFIRAQPQP